MPNLLAVLDEAVYSELPDKTVIGKDAFTRNEEKNQFFLNISPDEAEKVAFNLQSKFDNKKTELDKVHADKNALQKELAGYKKLGKSPDELKSALESNQPEEINALKETHRVEKETLENSFKETVKAAEEAREAFKRQLESTLRTNRIRQIRLDYDLNDSADANLERYIRFEPKEEGSAEYIERIYDETGNPALVAGQPMTVDQLLTGFKEQKKLLSIFNAPNGGGTGASNRQGLSAGDAKKKRYDEIREKVKEQNQSAATSFTDRFYKRAT